MSTDVVNSGAYVLGILDSSLVKVGTGTLTLSGHASLGGATIDGGTLAVSGGTLNIDAGVASTQNLIVGQSGVGTLAVQNGGTVTDFGGFIGDLPGSQGTATVSGAGSTWTNTGTIQVGAAAAAAGTLTIENGGMVISMGGGSIGLSPGSVGTVTVTGPRSTWDDGPDGGLNVGSFGSGSLTIANGGTVINNSAFAANIGEFAGSLGTVTVTGAGSTWSSSSGLNIGNSGTGTLTIADSGVVTAGPVVIATNAGAVGTLNIGAGAGSPAAAPGTLTAPSVAFGAGTGTINFNHTSVDYVFAPAISGDGTVNVLAGSTTLTGANIYSGATNVEAGTLRAGALNTFSPNSAVTVASGGTLDLNGFNQTIPGLTNAGLVNMGTGTAPGTVLTTTSYTGTGGTMAINTVLGGDNSPSDKLVISGGAGAGNTTVHVTNVGGTGAETTGNGIPVVNAISGATTTPGAFALPAGELRAGAFDYDLFRGGAGGASPNDWFLRSDFQGGGGGGGGRYAGGAAAVAAAACLCRSRHSPLIRRRTRCRPASPFRSSGPNSPPMGWCSLWRGNWGSASSARSTTGSATLTSRMVAPLRLRSLPPRPRLLRSTCRPRSDGGGAATKKPGPAPPVRSSRRAVWGRFFGQTIHGNNYQAFRRSQQRQRAIW